MSENTLSSAHVKSGTLNVTCLFPVTDFNFICDITSGGVKSIGYNGIKFKSCIPANFRFLATDIR